MSDFQTDNIRRDGEEIRVLVPIYDDDCGGPLWLYIGDIDDLGSDGGPEITCHDLESEWAELWDDWIDSTRFGAACENEVLYVYAGSRFTLR